MSDIHDLSHDRVQNLTARDDSAHGGKTNALRPAGTPPQMYYVSSLRHIIIVLSRSNAPVASILLNGCAAKAITVSDFFA
jgi:hypothetical protein